MQKYWSLTCAFSVKPDVSIVDKVVVVVVVVVVVIVVVAVVEIPEFSIQIF